MAGFMLQILSQAQKKHMEKGAQTGRGDGWFKPSWVFVEFGWFLWLVTCRHQSVPRISLEKWCLLVLDWNWMCDLAFFSQNRIWWPKVWCISICKASNVDSWMKRIASSLLTISLNPSFSLHMFFPLSQKFVHATSTAQKILRVSQQKNDAPPVLKEPENNNSSISTIFRIHKRSIRLHVKKPGSRLTFVAFQAPFSLIPLLVGWNMGGQKKRTAKFQRERQRVKVYMFQKL